MHESGLWVRGFRRSSERGHTEVLSNEEVDMPMDVAVEHASVSSPAALPKHGLVKEGWVYKWTNYMSNWKRRYVFLYYNGLLVYALTPIGPIKGKINIKNASLAVYSSDPCRIDVIASNGLNFFFRTEFLEGRNAWFSALKGVKELQRSDTFDLYSRGLGSPQHTSSEKPSTIFKEADEGSDRGLVDTKASQSDGVSAKRSLNTSPLLEGSPSSLNPNMDAADDQATSYSSDKVLKDSWLIPTDEGGLCPSSLLPNSNDRSKPNAGHPDLIQQSSSKIPIEALKENIVACKQHVTTAVSEIQQIQSKFISNLGKLSGKSKVLKTDVVQLVKKIDFLEQLILIHLNTTHRLAHDEACERKKLEAEITSLNDKCAFLGKLASRGIPDLERSQGPEVSEQLSLDPSDSLSAMKSPPLIEDLCERLKSVDSDPSLLDETGSNLEFFDCEDPNKPSEVTKTLIEKAQFCMEGEEDINPNIGIDGFSALDDVGREVLSTEGFRKRLPIAPSTVKGRIWSVFKQYLGSDLSMGNITMPVCFNEPTSLLQRIAEDFQYEGLLKKAARLPSSLDRTAWICVFAASPYASACGRTYKPFNPLLGETYEMDHKGFRFLAEQVGHHPPVTAYHVEGDSYAAWGQLGVQVRLTGKSLEVFMPGNANVLLNHAGKKDHFIFHRAKMLVHNIFFGDLWIEMDGKILVHNISTGDFGILEFFTKGWFNATPHKVKGLVFDGKTCKPQYFISGTWSHSIYMQKLEGEVPDGLLGNGTALLKAEMENSSSGLDMTPDESPNGLLQLKNSGDEAANQKEAGLKSVLPSLRINWAAYDKRTEEKVLVWSVTLRPPDSKNYFGFGYLTIELNQIPPYVGDDPVGEGIMPNTDSRFRPDQRAYEEGDMTTAVSEKLRLEAKQREKAKLRKSGELEYSPQWFELFFDAQTKENVWRYKGDYWEKKKLKQFTFYKNDIF